MWHLISLCPVFLLLFLCITPSYCQRTHRHAHRFSSFSKIHATAVTAGTAFPSGFNGTAFGTGGHNYTFVPHRTKPTSDELSITNARLSFNPGGPEIPAPMATTGSVRYNPGGPKMPIHTSTTASIRFNPGSPEIPASTPTPSLRFNPGGPLIPFSTANRSLSFKPGGPEIPAPTPSPTYNVCIFDGNSRTSYLTNYETQTTSSCSTVLDGFFTQVSITDCSQSVTFSTQSSFLLNSTTLPATGFFGSPATSTYVQSVVAYSIAPWQSVAAGDMSHITVVSCTFGSNDIETCTSVQETLEVHVDYVPVVSTATLSTTVMIAERFSNVGDR